MSICSQVENWTNGLAATAVTTTSSSSSSSGTTTAIVSLPGNASDQAAPSTSQPADATPASTGTNATSTSASNSEGNIFVRAVGSVTSAVSETARSVVNAAQSTINATPLPNLGKIVVQHWEIAEFTRDFSHIFRHFLLVKTGELIKDVSLLSAVSLAGGVGSSLSRDSSSQAQETPLNPIPHVTPGAPRPNYRPPPPST